MLMRPIITINGATRESHVEARVQVLNALQKTMEALCEIKPHGRDYIGDNARFDHDRSLWDKRFAKLDKMRNQIMDEALAIQEEGKA